MVFNKLQRVLALLFVAALALSCNDDIDNIGETIQPDLDGILLDVDEVYLTAETVSLDEKIYVRPEVAMLGEINDPVFGHMKADFLGEFFCSGNEQFKLGYNGTASIDSTSMYLSYVTSGYVGDRKSAMGVSVYEATKSLKSDFYTDINPLDYSDKKNLLGTRFFVSDELYTYVSEGVSVKNINVELNNKFGKDLYELWMKDPSVLKNSENLKKHLKGVYVTTDFTNKAITSLYSSGVDIYYSYVRKNYNNTKDSTVRTYLRLPMTSDVAKMNRVVNTPRNELAGMNDDGKRSFVKATSGIVTKITIPIKEIVKKAKEKTKSDEFNINAAFFKLVGLTEEENNLAMTNRVNNFLFINQDSIKNFFVDQKKPDGNTSIVMYRDSMNNSYNYVLHNTAAVATDPYTGAYSVGTLSRNFSNNLASLINYYIKNEDFDKETLEYLLIPVEPVESITSSSSSYIAAITGVHNLYAPAASILRTDKKNMKMSLVFSKHNDKPVE